MKRCTAASCGNRGCPCQNEWEVCSVNVTSYYPVFYAEDLEAEVKRYTEDLGFTIKHKTEVKDLQYYILENNGNRIDLVHTTISDQLAIDPL